MKKILNTFPRTDCRPDGSTDKLDRHSFCPGTWYYKILMIMALVIGLNVYSSDKRFTIAENVFADPIAIELTNQEKNTVKITPRLAQSRIALKALPRGWKWHIPGTSAQEIETKFAIDQVPHVWQVHAKGPVHFYYDIPLPACAKIDLSLELSGRGTVTTLLTGYAKRELARFEELNLNGETIKKTFSADLSTREDGPVRLELIINGDIDLIACRIEAEQDEGGVIVDGELAEMTPLPDPARADYPDCYITAKFKVNNIIFGELPANPMLIHLPAFFDRKPTPFAKLKPGDKVLLRLRKSSDVDAKTQSVQVADSLHDFDSEPYYVLNGQSLERLYPPLQPQIFFDQPQAQAKPVNSPVSPESQAIAAERMQKNLEHLEAALRSVQDEQQLTLQWSRVWEHQQLQYPMLDDGRRFFRVGKGFFAFPQTYLFFARKHIPQDRLAALQNLRDFLAFHGVHFIVVPLPHYYDVAIRLVIPEMRRYPMVGSAMAAAELLRNGIDVIEVDDAVLNHAPEVEWSYFYPDNPHPMDGAQDAIAAAIAEHLTDLKLLPPANTDFPEVSSKMVPTRLKFVYPPKGDLGGHQPGEEILTRKLYFNGKPFVSDPQASLILSGNSHIQYPEESSLASRLSTVLRRPVTELQQSGEGPAGNILQKISKNPEILRGKKAYILALPAGSFAEYYFFDIKKTEAKRQDNVNLRKIHTFDLSNSSLKGNYLKKGYGLWWHHFAGTAGRYSEYFIPKANQMTELLRLPLPEGCDPNKKMVARIKLAVYPRQSGVIEVNGVLATPVVEAAIPSWQEVEIPFHCDAERTIRIQYQGTRPENILGIKKIDIFQ